MKALKIVGFVVGGIVLVLVIVLALALTSSVQTWAVRKAVAGQPGLTLEVGKVDAGFSAADITDLRVVKDGMVITAKNVSAKYSAWDYLTQHRINADAVAVADLVVDLRNTPQPASAATQTPGAEPPGRRGAAGRSDAGKTTGSRPPEKGAPFEGLLKQAQLPFDIRVATLAAKGRALLPAEQTVVFDLKGDSIENGQRGKIEWTVDFADGKKGAALVALRSTGTAGVHISRDRRIDLIEVETIAAAMGPQIPADRVKITAKAEQPSPGANEGYTATVALLRGNSVEPLVKTNAQFLAASREIAGAWDIAVRSEQLAGLLSGLGLPPLAASGAGKFSFKPDTGAVAASGDLQGQASQLQKLSPALEAIGAVQFKTTFDGGLADNLARLEKLNLEVTGADGRKFAQISSLQRVAYSLADHKITLADPKAEVARISLQQLPLAWAQPVAKPMTIESGDLSLALAVEAEPDGSRIRARALEPLLVRNVTVRDANKKALAEQVTLSTRPSVDYSSTKIVAQLADLSVSMPTGDAVSGNVSADVTNLATTPAIAFAAKLQAKVVKALEPYLPVATGPLAASVTLEGRHEGQVLNLSKASVVVNREGGALLTTLELQQPVRADLAKSTFAVAKPAETAARVRLGEVPLAWAEPFVAKSKFAGALGGAVLDVSLRSLDDLTLTTAEPVVLRGVTIALEGKPQAQALDLTANLSATKRGNTIAYEVRRIEVKQGETNLAGLTVAGEARLGGKAMNVVAKGNLEADVAALMRQPALASFATLSRGRVAAAFDANLTDTIQATAAITAKDLVAKQDNRPLGDLDVKLNAQMKSDGSGTISLPVTLASAARKSDVLINGAFGKAQNQETFLFTGKISSNNLVVDDFQPLAGLAPAGEKPQPAAPKSTRDTKAFWSAVNGKVEVDLKRVLYGKDYVISGVHGTAVITDSKLSLDGLQGRFKENPFKLAGGMTFAANQPKPYSLTASADVQNLDIGEILRAANPAEKPVFETKASLIARLNGSGANSVETFKNAFGRFELTGTQGITRLLANKKGVSKAVDVLSTGLAIAGIFQKNAASAQDLNAAAQLTRMLNEVHFDTAKVIVDRNPDLSFKITSLEVLSPIVRVGGTGSLASKSAEDVANAPMNVVLQLGAKGELAHVLQRSGLIAGTPDTQGYYQFTRTFPIGGTPSQVDNTSIWIELGKLGLGAFLNR